MRAVFKAGKTSGNVSDRDEGRSCRWALSDKNAEYENLSARRDELRKIARRVMPEESRAEIKKEITELTEKLKALREEIKLSEDIRERSDKLKENIEKIDKEQEQRKEERGR